MVPDDLNAIARCGETMTMMKMELLCLPRLDHFDGAAQFSIVISRHDNRLAHFAKASQQFASFSRRGLIVHEISKND